MKNRVNKVSGLVLVFIVTVVFSGVLVASPGNAKTAMIERSLRSDQKALAGVVSPANRIAFQIAKDFAFAIEDSKFMDDDGDSLNFTIVDLVYLIDQLEGQSEAATLQNILKSVVRGTKTAAVLSAEIKAVANLYYARQTVEGRWYFNVGQSQVNLMMAAWAHDGVALKSHLKALQGLAKTAPKGTAPMVLAAINNLTQHIGKTSFSKEDLTAVVEDAKIINTQVFA